MNKDLSKIQEISSAYGCINIKTEPGEEQELSQKRPESILMVSSPENMKIGNQRQGQVVNTENEVGFGDSRDDSSPKSPNAGMMAKN